MVTSSPAGGFVYLTPDDAMANLQALQRKEAVRQWRQSIKEAFSHKCAYCGEHHKDLTLDHVQPKTRGGQDVSTNVGPACQRCNHNKGSEHWMMWYQRKPYYCEERKQAILQWINSTRFTNPYPIAV
jgi:hypothetical protein